MTFLNNLKNKFNNAVTKASVGATIMALPALSYAQSSTSQYQKLTDAANFDEVKTAVLTVAGAVVGVYVLYRGAKMILTAIRSA